MLDQRTVKKFEKRRDAARQAREHREIVKRHALQFRHDFRWPQKENGVHDEEGDEIHGATCKSSVRCFCPGTRAIGSVVSAGSSTSAAPSSRGASAGPEITTAGRRAPARPTI